MTRLLYTILYILAGILTAVLNRNGTITKCDPALVNTKFIGNVLVKAILVRTFVRDDWLDFESWDVIIIEVGWTIDFDLDLSGLTRCSADTGATAVC